MMERSGHIGRRLVLGAGAALLVGAALAPVDAAMAADLKIAMILPGPVTDNDWNSVGYNGLEAAGDALDAEVAYVENVSDADAERLLRDFAERGYDLIFAHSFSFGDAALNAAEDYPDTTFMAGTASSLAPNLGTYSNPDYQGAYLAGMIAAGASDSGTVGWVGGMPAPNMLANLHAYEAGAKEIRPDAKVLHTFIGSWFDPPKAKEAAIAQVEQGADVLSAQGVGVIDAAVEKERPRPRRNDGPEFPRSRLRPDQRHLGPGPACHRRRPGGAGRHLEVRELVLRRLPRIGPACRFPRARR